MARSTMFVWLDFLQGLFSFTQESIERLEKDRGKKKDIIEDKTVSLLAFV